MSNRPHQLHRRFRVLACLVLPAVLAQFVPNIAFAADTAKAAERAIGYLSVEVPRWRRENACYSCHNNGDAVRALAAAVKRGMLLDPKPLDDSISFLSSPEKWDANGPDGPFKDVKLARIQFAAALAELHASGLTSDSAALQSAAKLVADMQLSDGNWPADAEGSVGSPVTYGQPLATAIAVRVLRAADAQKFKAQIASARQWFRLREPRSVLDAAAVLLTIGKSDDAADQLRRAQALQLIAAAESEGGGWGPFVNSPPEAFDTALVLLALAAQGDSLPSHGGRAESISRGRAYLVSLQNGDGSWPATTRPPGVDSYAQQVSTTGWALQALLLTAADSGNFPPPESAKQGN